MTATTMAEAATTAAEEEYAAQTESLKDRLTRGGLGPEAVQKAISAFEAGDIHALNFAVTKNGAVVCPVPFELLVKCFPQLAGLPMRDGKPDADELRGMTLNYTINRHRFNKKSLTLSWPQELLEDDPPEATEPI